MLLSILSIIAGIAFIGAGIYFLSVHTTEKNKARTKGSGYIALGLGAFTIVWAIFLLLMEELAPVLAVSYMVILMIVCIVLIVLYK